MRVIFIFIALAIVLEPSLVTGQTVDVWLTTQTQSSRLEQQESISFTDGVGGSNPVAVDETITYQKVEGFGASFTDSAAYLLNWEATPAARTEAMSNLFTRVGDGIGVSFVRNPMGGSDLTRFHYSYDDNPPGGMDPQLNHFSIAHDQADIIPLLQQALQLNPDLTVMASPWSPPGWMKDSGSMIGGSLLPEMRTAFANYFVKYIQAYETEGIPVHYVSLQNEPLYVPGDYPGMGMGAEEQRDLLRDYIVPIFTASNISSRVLVYDHNWDSSYYPDIVLADPVLQASDLIAGTAWHGYAGTPGVMLALANRLPGKGNYQTEHSGGLWVGGDANQIAADFKEIIHVMRSAGKAFVKWSLVLDQNRGPNAGGCNSCSPLVFVDTNTGGVSYSIDYYTLGHFSKFVLPGAHRIYSANANGVVSAAFLNPDGSKVLIAFNDSSSSNTFEVEWGGRFFAYTLPGYSGATFTWQGLQAGSYLINPKKQIQASSFDVISGLITESVNDVQGGYSLGYADSGDYALYRNVSFTDDLTNVNARVASFGGGSIEFRLGSPGGTLISTVPMPNTGGWQIWQTVSSPVTGVNGTYDLYVVFKGGSSIGNLNWFRFEGDSPPGPVTQLIWDRQPGLATNGFPFAQQPILVTADQFGTPSTDGLQATLYIIVMQTAGMGPLLGMTNVNIGTSGGNGVMPFSNLQIDSVGAEKELTAFAPIVTNWTSGNLLSNGDFNLPETAANPDYWETWATGSVAWANHENKTGISYDGSFYMVVGGYDAAGGGCHQTVPATAGFTYELSVMSGADAWWLPYGEIRLFFFNAEGTQVGYTARSALDPLDYDNLLDVPHPWEHYTLSALAPPGTTHVRVELMSAGTGSIWYENAVLTEQGFGPVLSAAVTSPFTVHDYVPASSTNYIMSITHVGSGEYYLQFAGTEGTEYFVETTTNLSPPVTWEPLRGSTTLVTDAQGFWNCFLTNQADRQFFRSSEISP